MGRGRWSEAVDAVALAASMPKRFDALVVGHLMQVTSVFDLAAALHKVAPGLPMLLATASADGIGTDALMAAGISEIVHRPVISVEIAAALTRSLAIARHRSTRYGRNTVRSR